MKNNVIHTLIAVGLVCVFLFLFHAFSFAMARNGTYLDIAEYFKVPGHEVQVQLWNYLKEDDTRECLVIGARSFVKRVKREENACDLVMVPYLQFKNLPEVLKPLKGRTYSKIFIENKVRYWTNFRVNAYYTKQKNYLLNVALPRKKEFFALWPEKTTFAFLKDLAKMNKIPKPVKFKKNYLDVLWFRDDQSGSSYVSRKIKKFEDHTTFYWVMPDKISINSLTGLDKVFANYFSKENPKYPGKVIEFGEFKNMIRKEGGDVL